MKKKPTAPRLPGPGGGLLEYSPVAPPTSGWAATWALREPPGPGKRNCPVFWGEKKLVIPGLYVFICVYWVHSEKEIHMSVPLNLQKHPTQSIPNPCSLGNHFSIQPMSGANSFQVTASNPHPMAPDWLVLIPSGARDSLLLHPVFHGPSQLKCQDRQLQNSVDPESLRLPFELCPRSRIWLC